MKKVVSAALIALLMVLAYVAGRQHTARHVAATSARRVLYWVDPMHPDYKSDHPGVAPDCGMQLEPVYDEIGNPPPFEHRSQLPPGGVIIDGATQRLVGIRTATVERSGARRTIRLLGRVVPEDTRVYRINSGSDGFIRETYNDSVGVQVKENQKLAACYGPEYLSVASGFLAATAGVPGAGKDGSRTVPFPGAVSKQGFSSLQGYTDRLRNLGMSDAQIQEMAISRQLPESIDVVAPVDGFILERNVTPGQHFDRAVEFYRIADLSQVWILADISGDDARHFRPGATARVTLPDQGRTFTARVSDVLPQVDPAARIMKLRLEADNPGYALRPEMFVDVELPVAMPAGLSVPQDAVIESGLERRVFVERSSGVFEPRSVQTGWHMGGRVEIVSGLSEGELVVADGTFLVDSESRLKSTTMARPKQETQQKSPPRSDIRPPRAARVGKMHDLVQAAA